MLSLVFLLLGLVFRYAFCRGMGYPLLSLFLLLLSLIFLWLSLVFGSVFCKREYLLLNQIFLPLSLVLRYVFYRGVSIA